MKGIVVYSGKYGSTEQYARWIGEALKLEVRGLVELRQAELAACDYVVVGSSVHAGRLTAAGKLKKFWPILEKKRVLFYTTSGMPADNRKELEAYLAASVPARLPGHSFFPAGGRIDYSQYSPILKWLMVGIAKSEFKKRNPGQPVPADIGSRVMDAVDRKWIEPLIAEAKSLG